MTTREGHAGHGGVETLRVICYARGRGESWEAICVDFDIAVSGRSLVEVKASLRECIALYLEEVAESGAEDRRYLLTRRSPWFVRMELSLMTWVSGLRRDIGRSRKFMLEPEWPALR